MDFEKVVDNNEVEPEEAPVGTSDMEMAEFLAKHIDNPCEVEVAPGRVENIRYFYIREAERFLTKVTDPEARRLLEEKIEEYKEQLSN